MYKDPERIKNSIALFALKTNSLTFRELEEQKEEINELIKCINELYPGLEYEEFGSVLSDSHTKDSDRDLLVKQKDETNSLREHRKKFNEACNKCSDTSKWDSPAISTELKNIKVDFVPITKSTIDNQAYID